ncbi:toxin-antitoxin system HicB family antitoxin [Curtanaerobium respiraculi]|uniref:toxin-antitoxin system HicB family antitoxin n=1 Tax=Curtanaerobium respiraculi TaxID=2949669 RepID=UPI0024B35B63|nr:toxin-antitoxin system HicB family antitoxin [Curtanaerobium respiraculi]
MSSWRTRGSIPIATVVEFPSLSWLDADRDHALDGAVDLVDEVLGDLAASHEPIPVPFSERSFSGRFQVRLTPEKHRTLAIEAAEQGVSSNRLIASRV